MSGLNQPAQSIAKTTKLFINGEFPRTESGRSFPVKVHGGQQIYAQLCLSSRKDLRNAVEVALKAQKTWVGKTAYNRGQVLYRMAEMMEGKRVELESTLQTVLGLSAEQAQQEVDGAVNSFVYYAGFADKFSQVMASVNPVSGPFHNFTTPEAVGMVGLIYDKEFSLSEFVSQLSAIICSGNSVVAVFDQPGAVLLSELGEIFKTSDLPAGVINLLSGSVDELYQHMGQHMEVLSLLYSGSNQDKIAEFKEMATENMKRVVLWDFKQHDLNPIVAFTESKTVWHPVGV